MITQSAVSQLRAMEKHCILIVADKTISSNAGRPSPRAAAREILQTYELSNDLQELKQVISEPSTYQPFIDACTNYTLPESVHVGIPEVNVRVGTDGDKVYEDVLSNPTTLVIAYPQAPAA